MDDMDLLLAAKRTEKNSLAKNNVMVNFEPGEYMKMYSSEKRNVIFLIYSPGSKFTISSLSSLYIPFILCKFNVCGLVCRYCNFVHFILFLLSNSNFKKRWKEFGTAPPSIPKYLQTCANNRQERKSPLRGGTGKSLRTQGKSMMFSLGSSTHSLFRPELVSKIFFLQKFINIQ